MDHVLTLSLGGSLVNVELIYDECVEFLRPFSTEYRPGIPTASVSQDEINQYRGEFPADSTDYYIECYELVGKISAAMLPQGACLFHGVSFLWQGKAWILTAPPGTGKTTQYVLWKRRYGDEVSILNGDKPVLSFTDGGILVSPSPWCGKEGIQTLRSAPLGGIIYLQQAQENRIARLTPAQALQPLLRQFLLPRRDPDALCMVLPLLERILESVPVWLLANRGDEASAMLCHDTIEQYLEENHALSDS